MSLRNDDFPFIMVRTLEAPREFQKDIEDFIRLNRRKYYEPQLCVEQRLFYMKEPSYENDMRFYGAFIETIARACHLIMEKTFQGVDPKTVTIISNKDVKVACETAINTLKMISELEEVLQYTLVKTWVIDDDYKNILIMNFGEYEVRTGILKGLENRENYPYFDSKIYKLSIDYPHICQGCEKALNLPEIIRANKDLNKNYLIKLWQHPNIEFYCCSCYKKEMMKSNGK